MSIHVLLIFFNLSLSTLGSVQYFDCSPYEDGESYLTADVSIKCEGPDAGPYRASLGYVSVMALLFPLGIPMYYMIALFHMRARIDPSVYVCVHPSHALSLPSDM